MTTNDIFYLFNSQKTQNDMKQKKSAKRSWNWNTVCFLSKQLKLLFDYQNPYLSDT